MTGGKTDKDRYRDQKMKSNWQQIQNKFTWLLAAVTGLLLLFTILYACVIASSSGAVGSFISHTITASEALLTLRALSEVLTALFGLLITSSTVAVMWAMASTSDGITVSTWLSMSPNTSWSGLLELFKWRSYRNGSRDFHFRWIIAR